MAKNRNEIPEKLTWDLTTIYKTDKEWEAELTRIKSELLHLINKELTMGEISAIYFEEYLF